MIRFHDNWLEEPGLRDWLVKVTNDESRAYCRWCAIVLRAHKADLVTHGSTAKHAKNAESASLAGVNSGPMSVQIVPSDEQVLPGAIMGQVQRQAYTDISFTPFQRSPYSKRFRPEWQEIDELKAWLEPCQEDSTKAYCKMCAVQLRAHKHDLLLHGRSTKHKRCSEVASPSMPSTSTNANMMTVEYETTVPHSELVTGAIVDGLVADIGDEGPDLKKARLVTEEEMAEGVIQAITTDDGETTTVIIPGGPDDSRNGTPQDELLNGTLEDDRQDIKGNQISIIRVVDKPKNSPVVLPTGNYRTPSQGGSVRRRRGRLNAADVVRAIELNEFTGYEMLQMLKTIVPKL